MEIHVGALSKLNTPRAIRIGWIQILLQKLRVSEWRQQSQRTQHIFLASIEPSRTSCDLGYTQNEGSAMNPETIRLAPSLVDQIACISSSKVTRRKLMGRFWAETAFTAWFLVVWYLSHGARNDKNTKTNTIWLESKLFQVIQGHIVQSICVCCRQKNLGGNTSQPTFFCIESLLPSQST